MAKDKEGHGSEAHREGHKPQVEHGGYGKGSSYHDLKEIRHSEYKEAAAKATTNAEKYWAGSAGASVKRDYQAGRVKTVKAK